MSKRFAQARLLIFFQCLFGSYFLSIAQINLDNHAKFETARILNQDRIHQIFEDPKGFIWILSLKGTYRFDGIKLDRITGHLHEGIITQDSTEIIFSSTNQILKYNLLSSQFDTVSFFPSSTKITISKGIQITETKFAFASEVLVQYDRSNDSFFTDTVLDKNGNDLKLISLVKDNKDESILWLGTNKNGLVRYNLDDQSYKQFLFDCPEVHLLEETNTITALYPYKDGLYLGTWYGGVLRFNKQDHTYTQFFVQNKVFNDGQDSYDRIVKFIPDGKNLWISSYKGGMLINLESKHVLQHEKNGNDAQFFENSPQLIDSRKRLWIGLYAGLRLLDTLRNQFESTANPYFDGSLWEIPFSVVESKKNNTIYFCNLVSKGIYSYHRKNDVWKLHTPKIPTTYSVFKGHDFILDKDTLWVLEDTNLYYMVSDDEQLTRVDITYGNVEQSFQHFTRLKNGNFLFLSSFKGLFEVNINKLSIEPVFKEIGEQYPETKKFRGDAVYLDESQNLWLSWKNYIFVQPKEDSLINISPFFNNGKDFFNVHDIFETSEKIWISLEDGIYSIVKDKLPAIEIEKVSDVNADDIVIDQDGIIWCNTPNLYRIDPNTQEAIIYGINDGTHDPGRFGFEQVDLIGNEVIVSSRGNSSIFDPTKLVKNEEVPKPYISNLAVNGLKHESDTSIMNRQAIHLKSFQNDLQVDFSAIAYTKPLSVKFRYRLMKHEGDNWTEVTIQNPSVTYSELSGGFYKFQLQACNDNNTWSEIKSLSIHIAVPFIKRKSTWGLGALLLGSIIYGLYMRRINNLKNQSKLQLKMHELERKALKAQMDPHFVFNALNSIQSLITSGEERKSILYLNKFGKLLRGVLEKSQKTTSNLNDEIKVIENYLELEFLRLGDQYTYSIQMDESISHEDIQVQGLLFQPIIENAIHHGLSPKKEGGHLTIQLNDKEDHVLCIIEDNGVGRKRAKESDQRKNHKSAGMRLVAESLAIQSYLPADKMIRIIDLFNEEQNPIGTRVEIRIPINSIAI